MPLRVYQERAVTNVSMMLRRHRRVLLVLPTGAGKTHTATEMVRRTIAGGGRVLWMTHRTELIDQAYDTLKSAGLSVGALCASSSREQNPHRPVQVASVQTLLARDSRPAARLIIVDEAHHDAADTRKELLDAYGDTHVVGLTATPERGDGRGLGCSYDAMVAGIGTQVDDRTIRINAAELVDMWRDDPTTGLVPCRIVAPRRRLETRQIAQRPVDAYQQHGENRPCIVFSPDVAHATKHRDEFRSSGVTCELITGETRNRERVLRAFRSGAIQALTSVAVLTEGFDAPATSCVILARGCGTAGLYMQMTGRALRPAPGKEDALLLDLSGTSHTHGAPDVEREYCLDGRGIRRVGAVAKFCQVCSAVYEEYPCNECGFEPDARAGELRVTNDPLVKFAFKRMESHEERIATLRRWIAVARENGYKPGWVFGKFRAVYGTPLSGDLFKAARRSREGDADHAGDPQGSEPERSR